MTERITSEQDWANNGVKYPIISNSLVLPGPPSVFNTTLQGVAPAADRILTIPAISANADVVTTVDNQTIAGIKTFSGSIRLANAGGGVTNFNYYEEALVPIVDSFTYTGGPTSVNLYFIKIGRTVNMTIAPLASFNVTVGSVITSTAGIIPSRFRPLGIQYFIIMASGGGALAAALRVDNNGTITIGNAPTIIDGSLTNFGVANIFMQRSTLTWYF